MMDKAYVCCDKSMHLTLRTLVFNRNEITNVPIYTCHVCEKSIVSDRVKPELTKVVQSLTGSAQQYQKVAFQEFSEFTNLLVMVAEETEDEMIEGLVEDRINQLLDLLLLAQSLNDQQWVDELSGRIRQVI